MTADQRKQLRQIRKWLLLATKRCRQGILRQGEVQELHATAWAAAKEVLEKDSAEWRMIDRRQRERTVWWIEHGSGYADDGDARTLEELVSVFDEVLSFGRARQSGAAAQPSGRSTGSAVSTDVRDAFLCHAGQDKQAVVRPISIALTEAGISHWLDEAEIGWGDSITAKVNEGLRTSRYVIVVLSPAFLVRNWPQREFNAAMAQEAAAGEVKVLPLLFASHDERPGILSRYPLLADKRHLIWEDDTAPIVTELKRKLGRE
jgi:hypothetical protein